MNERDRIEYLMNLYGLTPSQFSDKTGIQRASVSHILSNRNKPSLEILLKIYHAFEDVELAWLVAGEGNAPTLPQESVENQHAIEMESIEEVQRPSNMLFSFMDDDGVNPSPVVEAGAVESPVVGGAATSAPSVTATADVVPRQTAADASPSKVDAASCSVALSADSAKRIKEIKIFYDNGTYETFLPEKM